MTLLFRGKRATFVNLTDADLRRPVFLAAAEVLVLRLTRGRLSLRGGACDFGRHLSTVVGALRSF